VKTFLSFLTLALLTTAAIAQPAPAPPMETVTVSGTGRAVVTPDRFTFSVGVTTVAPTVEEAVAENNRRAASVIAALKKAGAQDRDIQTSQFSINPQQDYQQGKLPRILGYQVSNNITVRSDKINEAGRLLGIAVSAGVNNSSGINFEVSDPARGRDVGLKAAFDDARAKATLLAQAAGRALGRAVTITEGAQGVPPPQPYMRAMAMEAQVAADVPIESGAKELTFTISATFELR
jgi:uncharacterized protein YggE